MSTRAVTPSTATRRCSRKSARVRTSSAPARSRCRARAYIGRFNFKGEAQGKRLKELSGGERNRVHLAKMLLTGGNVLMLDEPTNDLDVETLRALEEADPQLRRLRAGDLP